MSTQRQPEELMKLASQFLTELEAPFVGRHEESLVITLALMTGEHVVLIGEPGTAKSAIARRSADLLNARFFKYLLTKFTEPSELFGPLDIKSLRQGVYRRITAGKLPEAEIAFLDEIFNANSAVLNSILSIMQERVLYDGYTEIKVPLWTLVGASNRVPEEPELEALYDRFLFRQSVRPLDEESWDSLLDAAWKLEMGISQSAPKVMTMDDLRAINNLMFKVDLSPVKSKLIRLFMIMNEKELHISDRRKGKILKAIAAHAMLEGRMQATESDLIVLRYTVPKDIDDFDKVNTILVEELKTKERILRELDEIANNVKNAEKSIKELEAFDPRLLDIYKNLKVAKGKIQSLVQDVEDEEVRKKAEEVDEMIENLTQEIMIKLNM
ncbi:MoxR-like ATPase [Acidilobus saccharovorans 345-15]|uniref:MoxR-like ATPase n=2 Tax=Acidilobus TaxID=105850 RepID=D9Q2B9_ACIS3|nr:MoxR-like ATPase [Acidilobus saccharovorans 345-15]